MSRDAEADALRLEWEVLRLEHAALLETTEGLRDGHAPLPELQIHQSHLHDYVQRLHSWAERLDQFHARYGAVLLNDRSLLSALKAWYRDS